LRSSKTGHQGRDDEEEWKKEELPWYKNALASLESSQPFHGWPTDRGVADHLFFFLETRTSEISWKVGRLYSLTL